jgi:UDP-glucuronate 4-epimerase
MREDYETLLTDRRSRFYRFRVAEMLLEEGDLVTGVDNLNDAYDVRVKEYRLGG